MMNLIMILIILIFLVTSNDASNLTKTNSKTPNIILILMDDMGYGDLSCYGALDIHTPNIDRLGSEGIRFTNFLTPQAVCSASRAAILTGCYPNRIGITGALLPGSQIGLNTKEVTIAELLKQKNYATGIFGKWHLGDAQEFLPLNHGFDEYLGIPYSNDMWPLDYDGMPAKHGTKKNRFAPLPLIKNRIRIDTISALEDQSTLTSKFSDEAIHFIRRNKTKPFFLYIPHPMPHVPISASSAFRGKSKQGLYGDVIQEVDYHIGKIIDVLKKEGLEDNTIIIFTSDNGPWLNFGNHAGSAGGLREGKGTSFEGGQRVPCIIRWKGKIPSGLVANQLTSSIDIFPTIANLTDTSIPTHKIDGIDFGDILKGNMQFSHRKNLLYYYQQNSLEAVRIDNWKLVFEHPGISYLSQAPGHNGLPGNWPKTKKVTEALYDLRRDPGEQYDVQANFPEIVKELKDLAEEARADLGDDLQTIKGFNQRLPGILK